MKAQYLHSCVDSDGPSIIDMVDRARDITGATFRRLTDWQQWARDMGYAVGPAPGLLHLKDDWHVSYHRSTYRGRQVVYARHSAIEFIFSWRTQYGTS